MQPEDEPLATPKEAAAYLNVSPATLADWRLKGNGPAYSRMGRHVRYRWEALRQFVASGEVTPTDGAGA